MKKILLIILSVFLFAYSAGCSDSAESNSKAALQASGTVVNGYRILPIQKSEGRLSLTVYRGDYIKFEFDALSQEPLLSIPDLSIRRMLPKNPAEAPYFKMKTPGTFAFSLGEVNGDIIVVNYQQARYREVSANEAAQLINNEHPLILDVRTPGEYNSGHLQNAVLIPVQELQARIKELVAYKDREILIYCATGNRSTVAAKIMIDNNFKQIANMRHGIYDWVKKNFPVTR
ncbi:MAG: rhodanese-like domain-containing protein [Desulfobacterales bacterium]|nr:MAG: rhodanese-like domain-containing protein [Desulfobacterales bacterium]